MSVDPSGTASKMNQTNVGANTKPISADAVSKTLKNVSRPVPKRMMRRPVSRLERMVLPEIVIADPELTVGMPRFITVGTGFDALAHCLEAFCAPGYHPMADGIALAHEASGQWPDLPILLMTGVILLALWRRESWIQIACSSVLLLLLAAIVFI